MPQGNPRAGELYLHFKQKLYQIITVAEHSETGEKLVIYQALYGTFRTYARPLAMFISPVDREKYPDAGQRFRFQLVEPEADENLIKEQEADNRIFQKPEQLTEQEDKASRHSSDWDSGAALEQTAGQEQEVYSPEEKLMAFFDAETMEEKYKILLDMREDITDRMINNMAVVLDVVIEEGPLDRRYEELKTCIRTFRRYESSRLR